MSQSFSPTAGMQNGFDIARLNELNTREREIVSRRESLLGPSYKLMYEHPVEFVRGEGVFLYDAEDNAYLDCYNNVPSVGHCNPAVVDAVSRQIATLNTHTRYMSENILNYSEQLLSTFEPELGHVMYTCTGSEAVDLSLRIAKFYTGGTGIIVTDYAYHGITTTVAAISTTMGKYVPVDQHVRTVRAPDAYRAGEGVDVAQRLADDIEAAIADMERHGIKFAGFIADSIFSTDGLLTTPAGFLKKAIDVVHKYGGVYIADEVQPGFGRTGSHMWGYQRHGINPDLVVMGKPMGNGLPIAAVVAKPQLLADFGLKIRYFNTFAGNPVCIAAAQAVLNEIQNKNLLENSRLLGDYLLNGFRVIAENYPQIGDARGAGLYHAIEFVKDPDTKEPDTELTRKVVSELRERRILISTTGKGENSLKIRPLLTFSQDNADLLLNQFEDTLKAVIG
ncbi:aspartate aminotransferase family protein [Klebsiella pneumoniae]|uniref:aspartate aminotransferase family protein n=1 Tax=Klebsiella TaxID=570 RepID=UPI0009833CC6|nr:MULTISPECIES: aspartate aminotransferase family protein [Klebsiella]MDU3694280.1 aspartate aminotransferase family protein [Klebsiella michiganensis]AXS16858.1 aspartate aminotransferase family protein [Klebsiella pneumoniae]AXS53238.1 aspartate aminotransferase family protein [Klebsiella pneumoniae]MBD0763409.1 aspartate aminotransferase family protein [Klebsiella variicola]MCE0171899.1 aspartate aminotransferase family protein [Klebsiella pneumoniae]